MNSHYLCKVYSAGLPPIFARRKSDHCAPGKPLCGPYARGRVQDVSVVPLVVTSDLLAMLDKVETPWMHRCHSYLCDNDRGYIDWTTPSREGQPSVGALSAL